MAKKHDLRAVFRDAVFARDHHACRVCSAAGVPLDAHHITDRHEMPNGGYVPENGISLCHGCHWKAEEYHRTGTAVPGMSPYDLYDLIGSSYDQAFAASERLAK